MEQVQTDASILPVDLYVDVGGVKTRYWSTGEGRPLLLIHGFGDSVETWSRVVPLLSARHRVFALDVVGAGRTEKPAGSFTFTRLARFVSDFMDAVALSCAAVAGQSMGGGIALSLAIQCPEKVEKLILIDSAGLGREMPIDLRVCTLPVLGWLLTRPSRKRVTSFLHKCVYDPTAVPDDMVDRFLEFGRLPGAHAAMLSWLRSNADTGGWRKDVIDGAFEALGRLATPTLVIWGRQDQVIPAGHGTVAQQAIPGSRLHVLDPCGHIPQLERPEELVALLEDFLRD